MSNPKDPTADYRPYPKGPNFMGIVIGSSLAILIILLIALFVLHRDAAKMMPLRRNPTPNSLVRPLFPAAVEQITT